MEEEYQILYKVYTKLRTVAQNVKYTDYSHWGKVLIGKIPNANGILVDFTIIVCCDAIGEPIYRVVFGDLNFYLKDPEDVIALIQKFTK